MQSISITKKEHFKLFSKILSVYYESHKDSRLNVCAIYFHLYFEWLNAVLLFIFTDYTFRMLGYVWMVKFGLVEESSHFQS